MKTLNKMIICITIFMLFSLINIYSCNVAFLSKQLIWYTLGFFLLFIFLRLPRDKIYLGTYIAYIFLNLALLYLLLFGNVINGSKAWLNLGFFSFQPSEFMKIVLIVLLSLITSQSDKYIVKSFIIVLIPSILTFLEPDTGNVIFYLCIWFALIFYKIKNIKPIIYLGLVGLIFLGSFIAFYFFYQSLFTQIFGTSFFYRMDRLIAFTNNSSYQLNNALIGIGSSGLFNILHTSIYIPEAITDFAFALLITNGGFIYAIIYLFVNLFFDLLLIKMYKRNFGVMKSITFIFIIIKVIQESIHMLMNIGLFPITGITLPFISYGGSSLISYFIILGIINNHKVNMGNIDLDNMVD